MYHVCIMYVLGGSVAPKIAQPGQQSVNISLAAPVCGNYGSIFCWQQLTRPFLVLLVTLSSVIIINITVLFVYSCNLLVLDWYFFDFQFALLAV
jgi:hypothetical protein